MMRTANAKTNNKNINTMELNFAPFDRIIIGNTKMKSWEPWFCAQFSHIEGDFLRVVGGNKFDLRSCQVLPFEGNEYLLGTTDTPVLIPFEVETPIGTSLVVGNTIERLLDGQGIPRTLIGVSRDEFRTRLKKKESKFKFAIRSELYKPEDLELVREHILVVHNGKVVAWDYEKGDIKRVDPTATVEEDIDDNSVRVIPPTPEP